MPTTDTNAHGGVLLCYAWGESDWPVTAIVPDWEGVRRFIIDQWLGDEDATDYDGTPTLPRLKEEFDAPEWDLIDSLEWKFEIGGVRITKVFDVGAPPDPVQAPEAAAWPEPWRVGEFVSSARRPEHVLMLAVGQAQITEYGRHRDFVRWLPPIEVVQRVDHAADATGRTPTDYALEHAEYMAVAAEGLRDAVNESGLAQQQRDEATEESSIDYEALVDQARETLSESLDHVWNRIYEFRKRRDRARG